MEAEQQAIAGPHICGEALDISQDLGQTMSCTDCAGSECCRMEEPCSPDPGSLLKQKHMTPQILSGCQDFQAHSRPAAVVGSQEPVEGRGRGTPETSGQCQDGAALGHLATLQEHVAAPALRWKHAEALGDFRSFPF